MKLEKRKCYQENHKEKKNIYSITVFVEKNPYKWTHAAQICVEGPL